MSALAVKHKSVGIELTREEFEASDLHEVSGHVLNALTDVDVPSPTDGYALTYDDASGLWIASAPSVAVHGPSHEKDGADEISARGLAGVGSFEHIETIQLASNSPNIDFTGIDPAYNAFRLTIVIKRTYAGSLSSAMRFNGDSGENYDIRDILAAGATVTTTTFMGNAYAIVGTSDNTHFSPSVCWIQNLGAGTEKDYISIAGQGATGFRHLSGRWNNTTSNITRITLEALIMDFAAGSWVTLEGCKKT